MAKSNTPKDRPPRKVALRPGKTDAKGVPLTRRQRRYPLLPSDLYPAFQVDPNAPKHGYLPKKYEPITTSIPELNAIEWTERLHHAVIDAIQRADKVQIEQINRTGDQTCDIGLSSRQRLWLTSWNTLTLRQRQRVR